MKTPGHFNAKLQNAALARALLFTPPSRNGKRTRQTYATHTYALFKPAATHRLLLLRNAAQRAAWPLAKHAFHAFTAQ
jgi:hypothetical protein